MDGIEMSKLTGLTDEALAAAADRVLLPIDTLPAVPAPLLPVLPGSAEPLPVGGAVGKDQGIPFAWNQLFCGDALRMAGAAPSGSLDLLYLDPPFFTNRDFVGTHRSSDEALGFDDRWLGPEGRQVYLGWLEERVRAFRPLLAPTGVFLLHLDWHVVHYAKVMCDGIFGDERFQNELIWYYQTGGASKDRFSRKHDTILLYSNGESFPFDGKSIAIPRTAKAMKRAQCATGARIKASDTHKNPDDVLIVSALNPMATERTGYPTQKPVELLERLIKALTLPGGTVGDFFCGSGTTLVAAKKLGRRWVGCDVNSAAVGIALARLAKEGANHEGTKPRRRKTGIDHG